MKKSFQLLIFVVLSLFLVAPLEAGTIGKGRAKIFNDNEGSARNQATRNALRDAVEKGVGLFLNSQSVVKNWEVLRDEVFSSSRGFVKSYKVLRDERKGDVWYVEIDAEVATASIKNKLEELRILHKKMGNKRLMVIYNPRHPKALTDKHAAVTGTLTSIQTEFNNSGFRIFDQLSLGNIYDRISQRGMESAVEAWMKIANENQVDILVEFELVGNLSKKHARMKYKAAKVDIQMRIHNVSTGRLISNTRSTQKQMTTARIGSYDWERDQAKAGAKAGQLSTQEAITNIVNYYKTIGDIGNGFFMIFKEFDEDQEDTILDVLENLDGYQSLSELKNEEMLLEIEYFSNMEKSRLRRKIRRACKQKGIQLKSKQIAGNRFLFVNEAKPQ